ncbi:MAG: hypothetical protein LBC02_06680 [Planctomycetaceae bacterium]|jgi:hypothetical protein|nr:hypothetical protein [Planctomycetaceae bacterium]
MSKNKVVCWYSRVQKIPLKYYEQIKRANTLVQSAAQHFEKSIKNFNNPLERRGVELVVSIFFLLLNLGFFQSIFSTKFSTSNGENLSSDTSILLFSGESVLPAITKQAATFPEKSVATS